MCNFIIIMSVSLSFHEKLPGNNELVVIIRATASQTEARWGSNRSTSVCNRVNRSRAVGNVRIGVCIEFEAYPEQARRFEFNSNFGS